MNRLVVCILITGLSSCSKLDGIIEKRDMCFETLKNSHVLYLVNTSPDKKFRFTIRRTETRDNKYTSYSTSFHILEPGDEERLECDTWLEPQKFQKVQERVIETIDTNLAKRNVSGYEVVFD